MQHIFSVTKVDGLSGIATVVENLAQEHDLFVTPSDRPSDIRHFKNNGISYGLGVRVRCAINLVRGPL